MVKGEETVKGIVISCFPQGEYGKRLILLTDKYGKITVFATGAAKQGSKIIGASRPFTCGEFTLCEGKGAKNLHGVNVINSFEEIPLDPDTAFYGSYILETADFFAREGMTEHDAKNMLNLIYVTLSALSGHELSSVLIRRIYELRLLVHEGTYTEEPEIRSTECLLQWQYAVKSPLSKLFSAEFWKVCVSDDFIMSAAQLFNKEVPHKFNSVEFL